MNKYGGIWVDATMYFCDNTFKYFDDVNFNSVKTIKEVEELLSSYTHKDWAYDMENFAHTIKKAKQMYFDNIKNGKE